MTPVPVAPELHRFFDALAPMLEGRSDASDVEAALGPSGSGTAALGFYAELVRRNLHKILSDVFPAVRVLSRRLVAPAGSDPRMDAWARLAARYAADRPPSGADPNRYGAGFSGWLREQAELPADAPEFVPALWAEVADFEYTRVLAYHAADDDQVDDGFDRRVFVRQYSCDVPALAQLLWRDAAVVESAMRPTIVLVFRHARTLQLATFYLGAAGIAALARRQGLPLPAALAGLSDREIEAAQSGLIDAGVFFAATPSNPKRAES